MTDSKQAVEIYCFTDWEIVDIPDFVEIWPTQGSGHGTIYISIKGDFGKAKSSYFSVQTPYGSKSVNISF